MTYNVVLREGRVGFSFRNLQSRREGRRSGESTFKENKPQRDKGNSKLWFFHLNKPQEITCPTFPLLPRSSLVAYKWGGVRRHMYSARFRRRRQSTGFKKWTEDHGKQHGVVVAFYPNRDKDRQISMNSRLA